MQTSNTDIISTRYLHQNIFYHIWKAFSLFHLEASSRLRRFQVSLWYFLIQILTGCTSVAVMKTSVSYGCWNLFLVIWTNQVCAWRAGGKVWMRERDSISNYMDQNIAQWEFGRPTLTPNYLEDKTEAWHLSYYGF